MDQNDCKLTKDYERLVTHFAIPSELIAKISTAVQYEENDY